MKIAFIFGTRPEAIKLAPVILAAKGQPDFTTKVCVTGQHREMLDQVLEMFAIPPDHDLNLMQHDQTLAQLTSRAMEALDAYLSADRPDFVMVQGDTTTAFVATLAAFYHNIPVGHVEAGLRTYNLKAPWPEEANRTLITRLAELHFAPTEKSKTNLLKELVPEKNIFVTGNTVIDALFIALEKVRSNSPDIPGLGPGFFPSLDESGARLILVTGHRRENFGKGFEDICLALQDLARRGDVRIVYPVHLNPNVQEPVMRILGHSAEIQLIKPISYLPFIYLMDKSHLIISDSGGVQEEAPSLGKPVLVMRETTERPEAVEAGTVKLVGTDRKGIVSLANRLLDDGDEYNKMSFAHNPYGDGKTSPRIVKILRQYWGGLKK